MMDRAIGSVVCRLSFVTFLSCLVTLLCAPRFTVAVVVGDRVELKATHQAGVPL
jgi:hypothetical protein